MINEPYPYQREWSKSWFSPKFHGPGLRYEIAISILSGDIVWVNGPFPCGDFNDLQIFMDFGLKDNLEKDERVEADDGYGGADPEFTRTRSSIFHSKLTAGVRNEVRARHETANKRIKQFAALSGVFRHDLCKHSTVFLAIVLATQIAIEEGESLFEIEGYHDDDNQVTFDV